MSRRCVRSASFLFPVSSVVLSVGGNLSLFALLLFAAELVDCGQVAGPPAPQRGDHLSLAGDAPSGWHFRSAGSRPSRPAGPSLATPAELPIKLPILALLDSTARSSSGHELEHINGSSLLLTAQDAVAHVNALQLVPGFQLELVVNDSKVSHCFLGEQSATKGAKGRSGGKLFFMIFTSRRIHSAQSTRGSARESLGRTLGLGSSNINNLNVNTRVNEPRACGIGQSIRDRRDEPFN